MEGELRKLSASIRDQRMPRPRQRLGKYRIERVIGEGGFATVYRARDLIEGIPVALKVFRTSMADVQMLQVFSQEARVNARLDHPNILAVKDANIIDGYFVIVSILGKGTLADRLSKRMSARTALHFAEEILAGLAHAHENRVVHLDVKPENFILFPNDTLRLTDFGIARFVLRTLQGSGSGTVGYVAPEQAMGKPSYRSDVFSVGLILWRMFSGKLPEWPFDAPLPGHDRLRRNLHRDFVDFLRRAISVQPTRRFTNCSTMLSAFEKLAPKALRSETARRRKRNSTSTNGKHWSEVRIKQFLRDHKKSLDARHSCPSCDAPIAESMLHCPWCKKQLRVFRGEVRQSRRCKRCKRGMKPDWRYCGWCFGKGQPPETTRTYEDKRYEGRCSNSSCSRKVLMPFMRYCPWCRTKVRRKWRIPDGSQRCGSCGWGVLRDYWECCPWCGKAT